MRLKILQGDILEDIALIENLEETKRTAMDIAEKVTQAQDTGFRLSKAREVYRPVAARGALVYFLVDALSALDRVYHYTMATFVAIMLKGMTFFLRPCSQPAAFNPVRTWREQDCGTDVCISQISGYAYLLALRSCCYVGMDATPGGKDESKVPIALRRGQEMDVGDRVLLLMSTISITIFNFISQVSVCLPSPDCFHLHFCIPEIIVS